MTLLNRASIDMVMRVEDSTGRPIEIDRDVLRRAYMALMAMGRALYARHRPPARFPEEALSLSFHEPSPGVVVFAAEVVADGHLRARDQPVLLGPDSAGPARSAEHALRLSVHGLVEFVRAYGFVLAAPQTLREVRCDRVDLAEDQDGRRLRVLPEVDYALQHGCFDAQMREFLAVLARDGVGGVCLSCGAEDLRSQIHHMVMATDRVLEFVHGAQPLRPLDRIGTDPDPEPGSASESEPGAA